MRVLLVWQELPEDVKFYVLLDPTGKQLETLEAAQGAIINSDNEEKAEEAVNLINVALAEPKYADNYGGPKEWKSIWHESLVEPMDLLKHRSFDRVFTCGFLL